MWKLFIRVPILVLKIKLFLLFDYLQQCCWINNKHCRIETKYFALVPFPYACPCVCGGERERERDREGLSCRLFLRRGKENLCLPFLLFLTKFGNHLDYRKRKISIIECNLWLTPIYILIKSALHYVAATSLYIMCVNITIRLIQCIDLQKY